MSFDFDAAVTAPFRMQPGLRRLPPGAAQLTPIVAPQRGDTRHLREKLAVFAAFPEQSLCAVPGFDAAPAVAALAAHAAAEQPQAASWNGHVFHARWLGWSASTGGSLINHDGGWPEIGPLLARLAPSWRLPALIAFAFAEDFAIVRGDDATIPWLAVGLPSGWAPEDKVGRHFAEVHAPVADGDAVVKAAPHFARLVGRDPSERYERFVWTLSPHPRLHAHPRRLDPQRWPAGLSADEIAAHTWWRTERQSFIPVPGAAQPQAVFAIEVQIAPMHVALADPARAARVHDALASMSPEVLAYRGLDRARDRLLTWLAARAAGAPRETAPAVAP